MASHRLGLALSILLATACNQVNDDACSSVRVAEFELTFSDGAQTETLPAGPCLEVTHRFWQGSYAAWTLQAGDDELSFAIGTAAPGEHQIDGDFSPCAWEGVNPVVGDANEFGVASPLGPQSGQLLIDQADYGPGGTVRGSIDCTLPHDEIPGATLRVTGDFEFAIPD